MATADEGLAITLEDVQRAAERIRPLAHVTPVMTCSALSAMAGADLQFKCEVFQRTGAFKFRGAANAVMSMSAEEASRGVVTHSSGNHAAALALAARLRGVPAHIVVPRTTPAAKVEAIEGYGGTVYKCEPSIDAREQMCSEVQAQTGAAFVHPYNDPRVMAGQGTIALELLEQVPDLDAIVVPISGGGMISGISVAAKALKPSLKIIGAEPTGTQGPDGADAARCKEAGQLLTAADGIQKPITVADGLQGRLGSNTWPVIHQRVDAIVTVSEQEIVSAMRLVFSRMKVVVEPSGAVGLAAVLSPSFAAALASAGASGCGGESSKIGAPAGPQPGVASRLQKIGVVLCGGNVCLDSRGLWAPGQWEAVP